MATTDEDVRRDRSWNLRFRSHFSVCYWRHIASKTEHRQRLIQWPIAGIGLVGSILLLIVTQEWLKSLIPAASLFPCSFLATLVDKTKLAKARFDVERWNGLASDVDSLWDRAERRGWKDPDDAEHLGKLYERAGGFEAQDGVYDDDLRRRCYLITCRELQVDPIRG